MYFLSLDTRNKTAPGYCIMEHVKRCGRRGSDVLHSMGVLSITCVVHVAGAVDIRVLYTHALTRDHYRTSCTDMKWRVYETLQCEQNGGLELAWSRVSL